MAGSDSQSQIAVNIDLFRTDNNSINDETMMSVTSLNTGTFYNIAVVTGDSNHNTVVVTGADMC